MQNVKQWFFFFFAMLEIELENRPASDCKLLFAIRLTNDINEFSFVTK